MTDTTDGWRHDRFITACRKKGLDDPAKLANAVSGLRWSRDPEARAMATRSAKLYLTGQRAPTRAAAGQAPAICDLADVLGVSIDWLLGRDDV